jgi:hypothetical protein
VPAEPPDPADVSPGQVEGASDPLVAEPVRVGPAAEAGAAADRVDDPGDGPGVEPDGPRRVGAGVEPDEERAGARPPRRDPAGQGRGGRRIDRQVRLLELPLADDRHLQRGEVDVGQVEPGGLAAAESIVVEQVQQR